MRLKEALTEIRLMGPTGVWWFLLTKAGHPPVEVDVHKWNAYRGHEQRCRELLSYKGITNDERRKYKRKLEEAEKVLKQIEQRRPDIKQQSAKLTPIPKRD